MDDRRLNPSGYALVIASEGATWSGARLQEYGEADAYGHRRKADVGFALAEELHAMTGVETVHSDLTYDLRSGDPDALDQMAATTFANIAVELLAEGISGRMVAIHGGKYTHAAAARSGRSARGGWTWRACTTWSACGRATTTGWACRSCWAGLFPTDRSPAQSSGGFASRLSSGGSAARMAATVASRSAFVGPVSTSTRLDRRCRSLPQAVASASPDAFRPSDAWSPRSTRAW